MIERVENPELWVGRLTDPLPGRPRRERSETVVQQEARNFEEFKAFAEGLGD